MPKLKKHFPKLCRHHKGQAFVKIDGQYVWLGRYGDPLTQEKYDRFIAEWLANGRSIPRQANSERVAPIMRMIAEYWRYAKRTYRLDVNLLESWTPFAYLPSILLNFLSFSTFLSIRLLMSF